MRVALAVCAGSRGGRACLVLFRGFQIVPTVEARHEQTQLRARRIGAVGARPASLGRGGLAIAQEASRARRALQPRLAGRGGRTAGGRSLRAARPATCPTDYADIGYHQYRDIRFGRRRASGPRIRPSSGSTFSISASSTRIRCKLAVVDGGRSIPHTRSRPPCSTMAHLVDAAGSTAKEWIFPAFASAIPINTPDVFRGVHRLPGRELFPRRRPQPALRPVRPRPRDQHRRAGGRGVPGLPAILDRAARRPTPRR